MMMSGQKLVEFTEFTELGELLAFIRVIRGQKKSRRDAETQRRGNTDYTDEDTDFTDANVEP